MTRMDDFTKVTKFFSRLEQDFIIDSWDSFDNGTSAWKSSITQEEYLAHEYPYYPDDVMEHEYGIKAIKGKADEDYGGTYGIRNWRIVDMSKFLAFKMTYL